VSNRRGFAPDQAASSAENEPAVISASQVDLAQIICRIAHAGQTDKVGQPYHRHPERVAEILLRGNPEVDGEQVAAALLHDVLEDTAVNSDDLAACGIADEVIRMLHLLTRCDAVPDEVYYATIASDPRARAVKLADISDNTDERRQTLLDEPTRRRLRAKYSRARKALGAEE